MRFLLFLFCIFSNGLWSLPKVSLPNFSEEQLLKNVVEGNNQFAFDLFHQLKKQPGNFSFSPFNILSGLGIVAAGAKGETLNEFHHVYHYSMSLLPLLGDLNAYYLKENKNIPQIYSSNVLWISNTIPLYQSYRLKVQKQLLENLYSIDFAKNLHQAIQDINQAMPQKANLPNVINIQEINSQTKLLLTTAAGFSGGWKTPFEVRNSKRGPFKISSERTIQTGMMQTESLFPLLKEEKWNLIALPYQSKEEGMQLEMIIFIPQNFLNTMEDHFTFENWKKWVPLFKEEQIILTMPRFQIDKRYDLNQPLKQLGFATLFDKSANLLGISEKGEGLFLDRIFHKTKLIVDENGTNFKGIQPLRPKEAKEFKAKEEFQVDRPFIFSIWDRQTKMILWMGRVTLP